MNNSKPRKTLCQIANAAAIDVAVELGRPWRLEQLRATALDACRAAMQGIARSGLSREQAYELLDSQRIKEQVLKTDGEMEALPPGQSKPTPEQIETALEAFSVKQWTPVERWPPIELSPPMERWPIIEY